MRPATAHELGEIAAVINDGASAYRGVIPADCWHEPYMSERELRAELAAGVEFTVIPGSAGLNAVMGLQARGEVMLIRHAYVRTRCQGRGLGDTLLRSLAARLERPLLIGTWAAARWAIDFYTRRGFVVLSAEVTEQLLQTYWQIPARQRETSVVLADTNALKFLKLK